MSLDLVTHVIAATPRWVIALFGYVLLQGHRRLSPHVSTIRRVAVVPTVFILWGLYGLFARSVGIDAVAAAWLPVAAAGAALGTLTSPQRLRVDRWCGLVWQPGSPLPLLRLTLIFGAHYGLNIAMAMHPDARHALVLCDIAVSGLSAGYFIGWIATFLRTVRQAPEADLSGFDSAAVTS